MKLVVFYLFTTVLNNNNATLQTWEGFESLEQCQLEREALSSKLEAKGFKVNGGMIWDDIYTISECKEYKTVTID